jgi:hypothetical protein
MEEVRPALPLLREGRHALANVLHVLDQSLGLLRQFREVFRRGDRVLFQHDKESSSLN